tara:strand:- start:167 stop:1438 length:1272 start_codon:yes stop_codon:yes gene_type:complete
MSGPTTALTSGPTTASTSGPTTASTSGQPSSIQNHKYSLQSNNKQYQNDDNDDEQSYTGPSFCCHIGDTRTNVCNTKGTCKKYTLPINEVEWSQNVWSDNTSYSKLVNTLCSLVDDDSKINPNPQTLKAAEATSWNEAMKYRTMKCPFSRNGGGQNCNSLTSRSDPQTTESEYNTWWASFDNTGDDNTLYITPKVINTSKLTGGTGDLNTILSNVQKQLVKTGVKYKSANNGIMDDNLFVYRDLGNKKAGPVCNPGWDNGGGGICNVCATGFTGDGEGGKCNKCLPNYYPKSGSTMCSTQCNAETTCSGNGTCNGEGTCVCQSGYWGVACQVNCGKNSIGFFKGKCMCQLGWGPPGPPGKSCNTCSDGYGLDPQGGCVAKVGCGDICRGTWECPSEAPCCMGWWLYPTQRCRPGPCTNAKACP